MTERKTRRSGGALRPVAGREQILAAGSIGVRQGWKAVTIRAVAQRLGYSSPLLYEHFRDKEDILTQLAYLGSQQATPHYFVRRIRLEPCIGEFGPLVPRDLMSD